MIDTPARVASPPNHRGTVAPSRFSPAPPAAFATRPTCAQAAGGFTPAPSGAVAAAPRTARTADQDSVVDTSASPSVTTAPPSRVQAAILLSLVPWAAEASSRAVAPAGAAPRAADHAPATALSASTPARMTSTALCLAVHAFVLTHHSTPRVSTGEVTFRVATYPERLVPGIAFCQVPVQPEGIGEGFSSAWSWAAMMSTARSPGAAAAVRGSPTPAWARPTAVERTTTPPSRAALSRRTMVPERVDAGACSPVRRVMTVPVPVRAGRSPRMASTSPLSANLLSAPGRE